MTEDLTNKLNPNADEMLTLILMAVNDLSFRVGMSEHKFEDFTEKVERRLQNVTSDIALLHEGQRRLEEGLQGLGGRLQGLGGRLQGLEGRLQGLEEGQTSLRSDLTAFRRHVDQQFRTLSGTVEKRYREHDQRITRLETNANQANSQT